VLRVKDSFGEKSAGKVAEKSAGKVPCRFLRIIGGDRFPRLAGIGVKLNPQGEQDLTFKFAPPDFDVSLTDCDSRGDGTFSQQNGLPQTSH